MAEGGDPCIETEAICQYVFDVLGTDGVELAVGGSLRDDDDSLALSYFAMLPNVLM